MSDVPTGLRDESSGLFQPDGYADIMRAHIPFYDDYQQQIAARAAGLAPVTRILDLGIGTGETSSTVIASYPDAGIVGIDESAEMLEAAAATLGDAIESLSVGNFGDELPDGPFDIVIASLAIHHLEHAGKRDIYQSIFGLLRSGGRFVQGDLRTDGPTETRFDPTDIPAAADDMVSWLTDVGFEAELTDEYVGVPDGPGDICIIVADRPA